MVTLLLIVYTKDIIGRASYRTNGSTKYEFNLKAKCGDTIKVYVENAQCIFESDIERGLRIYKTATDAKLPIEGITFDVYEIPAAVKVFD